MQHRIKARSPVNIILVFALVLLSPLPFLSPFSYDNQTVQALPFNNPNLPDAGNSMDRPVTTQNAPTLQSLFIDPTSENTPRHLDVNGEFEITLQTNSTITRYEISYGTEGNNNNTITRNVFTNESEIAFTLVVKPGFNGTVTFSIDVVTDAGNLTNITNADLTPATEANPNFIIADSTGPLLALHGDSYVTLFTSQTYNDAGAYTNELNDTYVPTITSNIGSIDFTIPGTYTITYSANADPFGNTAIDATRTVRVYAVNPIPITSLSIASSSGNNFANASKTITVTLDAESNDLGNFDVTLLGKDIVKANVSSGSTTFTTTVLDNDTNGDTTFSITATNSTGSTLIITNSNITDSSFVIIDTIKPMITLNGPPPYTVQQGHIYTDPGATATDLGNSSYTPTVTASTLDTSSVGTTTITYTAPADAAGNVPYSVNRTVTVHAAKPIQITSLSIASSSGNNFANAGRTITVTLDAESNDLGNFDVTLLGKDIVKANLSSGSTTFTTTVLDNDPNGDAAFSIIATNSTGSTLFITNSDITDSSFVTIDTVKPVIRLNGASLVKIIQEATYSDQGAAVD